MHVGASLEDLASFLARPHHEGVHGALDVRSLWVVTRLVGADDLSPVHLTCEKNKIYIFFKATNKVNIHLQKNLNFPKVRDFVVLTLQLLGEAVL